MSFRQGTPFYELLITFVAASAGFTPVFDGEHYGGFLDGTIGAFPGRVCPEMRTNLGQRVQDVRSGAITRATAESSLACMLATAAWDVLCATEPPPAIMGRPEVQYLRHVRNAAAHGNHWHFSDRKGRETPDMPAQWRTASIDHSLKGRSNPLHGQQCFGNTLGSADLLRLMLDIEPLLM
ncbi:MAG TPA: hypothetical protein VIY30_16670 [Burkholderiaceae bacterium]